MTDYRNISMWHDTAGDEWNPRPSLPGPTEVDVAIIGAGFTGLWTAYYLKKTDPSLRIAVVEKEVAGFGPSGRNGGWVLHLSATGVSTPRRFVPMVQPLLPLSPPQRSAE